MLLVIVHHAIIVGVAMIVMSQLVWRAQSAYEDWRGGSKHGVFPDWIVCHTSGKPPKRRPINSYLPFAVTSIVSALGCWTFIVAKNFQSQLWFNLGLDLVIGLTGVTLTHLYRFFDPEPTKVVPRNTENDVDKKRHVQKGPSHLVFGLLCGLLGAFVAISVQSGSNLAVCLAVLGCGHAGLLIKFRAFEEKPSGGGGGIPIGHRPRGS
jgi:hypothetical protein